MQPSPRTAPPKDLITDAERRGYNLQSVLKALHDPQLYGRAAGLEHDISKRARQAGFGGQRDEGIFVPFDVLTRDLVVGTPSAGGNLVATDVLRDKLIDLLRPASVSIAAGAEVLSGLSGNVLIPRMTGGAVVQWVGENVAPAESQQAFDQVAMSPKTAAGYVDFTRRLFLQTGGDVQRFVARDLMAGISTAIDQAAILGAGTGNQPRGLLSTPGIGSVQGGTNGAAPTYDNIVDLESTVANQNTLMERPAYVTNSRVRARLERTQKFIGTNGDPVWLSSGDADMVKGRRAYVSNSVPNNLTKGTSVGVCSAILYGNWSDLLIGLWGEGITLMVDPYTQSTTGGVRTVVMVDCDVAVRYPTSFSSMQDALTI
jgi:HK97 family phage major capsid protein